MENSDEQGGFEAELLQTANVGSANDVAGKPSMVRRGRGARASACGDFNPPDHAS